ncbi:MAG: hypothetical protein GTO14_23355 [Anaerolineales bacterium]|nr:hypothetical protein [Anaerolineales bacterium]
MAGSEMHAFRVIILNLLLSVVAIAITSTAFILDRLWTFQLPDGLEIVAWPLLLFGAFLIIWAVITLARYSGSSGAPGDPTKRLVKAGPYAWIRNPIYAGDAFIIIGLAFLTGSPTMLIYALLFMILIDRFVRLVEEPATKRRLGEEYVQYCERVPRWIPRLRKRNS